MKKNARNNRRQKPSRKNKGFQQPGLLSNRTLETLRIYNYKLDLGTTDLPLILRWGAMITNCGRMLELCKLKQQYKLESVRVKVKPELNEGNSPSPLYMLTSYDRNATVTVDSVLETGRPISNLKETTIPIRARGRQNDFGYWFDCRRIGTADERPTLQFSFVADEFAGKRGVYYITIDSVVSFRYPQYSLPPINREEALKKILEEGKKKEESKEEKKEEEIKEEEEIKDDDENLDERIKKLEEELKLLKLKKSFQ